jgi:hypothetical protein
MLTFLVCLYIYICIFIIEVVLNLLEICKATVCNARFESNSGYNCGYSLLICYTLSTGKKYQLTQCQLTQRHVLEHLSLIAACSQ